MGSQIGGQIKEITNRRMTEAGKGLTLNELRNDEDLISMGGVELARRHSWVDRGFERAPWNYLYMRAV